MDELKKLRLKSLAFGRKTGLFLPAALTFLFCVSHVYGDSQRPPIDINLIIDGALSSANLKEEITTWICNRIDQILTDGDSVRIWNAGSPSKVIYSGTVNNSADRENIKKSIRELSGNISSNSVDFSYALKEAADRASGQQNSSYSYTLLISASADALASVLSGPQANLLRYSRVEEFPAWRAIVIGLNIDAKVRNAAAAFWGS
ncbi:MAG: hypothetical protein LBC76_03300 [Treponema sp.]|jgi:hypothetical protein|nr:hypothetical protein [Treponema sp.]